MWKKHLGDLLQLGTANDIDKSINVYLINLLVVMSKHFKIMKNVHHSLSHPIKSLKMSCSVRLLDKKNSKILNQ